MAQTSPLLPAILGRLPERVREGFAAPAQPHLLQIRNETRVSQTLCRVDSCFSRDPVGTGRGNDCLDDRTMAYCDHVCATSEVSKVRATVETLTATSYTIVHKQHQKRGLEFGLGHRNEKPVPAGFR